MTSEAKTIVEIAGSHWKGLYKVGGAAALIAGVIFRRNLGAEISLFGAPVPGSVIDWFALLQNNRILGFAFLNFFDVIDYALVGLIFLALCNKPIRALWQSRWLAASWKLQPISPRRQPSPLHAFPQQPICDRDNRRAKIHVTSSRAGGACHQSGHWHLFKSTPPGHCRSDVFVVMLRSGIFSRRTTYLGILANRFDLAYCITVAFVPVIDDDLIAICTLPTAGLLLMIWHILIGIKLFQLGNSVLKEEANRIGGIS